MPSPKPFEVKLFEILDSATWIKAMAIRLGSRTPREILIMTAAGYGNQHDHENYIALISIEGGHGDFVTDPYDWEDRRSFRVAHEHIVKNWDTLKSGDVIDVQFLLKETDKAKASVFEEYYGEGQYY